MLIWRKKPQDVSSDCDTLPKCCRSKRAVLLKGDINTSEKGGMRFLVLQEMDDSIPQGSDTVQSLSARLKPLKRQETRCL